MRNVRELMAYIL